MDFLWKFSTYLVLIPSGCMKLVQTSDLFIKLFKDVVNKLATGNMQEHLQDDLTGKITADYVEKTGMEGQIGDKVHGYHGHRQKFAGGVSYYTWV